MRERLIKVTWWIMESVIALVTGALIMTMVLAVAVASLPVAVIAVCINPRRPVARIESFYRKQFEWWISLCRDFIP